MFKELFLDVTCLKLDRLYSNKTMGAVLYPVNSAFFFYVIKNRWKVRNMCLRPGFKVT